MFGNFVFDLDGAVAIAVDYQPEEVEKQVREQFGDAWLDRYRVSAYNFPHYVFPGYYALLQWLHAQGGRLFFFSSGIEERNVELVGNIMKHAFGDDLPSVPYKVFSRQHCINTQYMNQEESDQYQSFFYGQRKKKLAGVVVPEAELPDTLLIDDDNSYVVKGEEFNFICLRYCYQYVRHGRDEAFTQFHRAYYLAGLLSSIFQYRDAHQTSLAQAAKHVQIDSLGLELNDRFYFPGTKQLEYYLEGKKILNEFDPSLDFYFPLPEPPAK